LRHYQKIYNENAVLNKNDLIDLVIMYSLNLDGYLFLTLDTKLQDALKSIHEDSYNLIKVWGLD